MNPPNDEDESIDNDTPKPEEEELPKEFEDLSEGEEVPNEPDKEVEELEDLINPKE